MYEYMYEHMACVINVVYLARLTNTQAVAMLSQYFDLLAPHVCSGT